MILKTLQTVVYIIIRILTFNCMSPLTLLASSVFKFKDELFQVFGLIPIPSAPFKYYDNKVDSLYLSI